MPMMAHCSGGTVIDDIKNGSVAVIGLPCNIARLLAILRRDNIDTSNLVTIDLICGGATLAEVGTQYIDCLEKRFKSRVVEFSVRFKNPDWNPPYLRAVFSNGKVFCEPFYETEYGYAFEHMKRMACYKCQFKDERHLSDITIGDAWGIEKGDNGWNDGGVSVAFVHTEKGLRLIEQLQGVTIIEADADKMKACNPRYLSPKPQRERDIQFRLNYDRYGLMRACKNVRPPERMRFLPRPLRNFLRTVKRCVKRRK